MLLYDFKISLEKSWHRVVGSSCLFILMLIPGCGGGSSGTGADVFIYKKQFVGTVVDQSGAPLANLTVTIAGTDKAATTNDSGDFEFIEVDAESDV